MADCQDLSVRFLDGFSDSLLVFFHPHLEVGDWLGVLGHDKELEHRLLDRRKVEGLLIFFELLVRQPVLSRQHLHQPEVFLVGLGGQRVKR